MCRVTACLFAGYIAYTYLRCAAVQATQHARETLEAVAAQGKLGKAGWGGKVIYAQTDSIFASFPNATTEEAIQVCCIISASSHLRLKPCAGLGWVVLCCAVLCCAVLCCAVLGWAGLWCAVLCWAGLGWAVMQHDGVQSILHHDLAGQATHSKCADRQAALMGRNFRQACKLKSTPSVICKETTLGV